MYRKTEKAGRKNKQVESDRLDPGTTGMDTNLMKVEKSLKCLGNQLCSVWIGILFWLNMMKMLMRVLREDLRAIDSFHKARWRWRVNWWEVRTRGGSIQQSGARIKGWQAERKQMGMKDYEMENVELNTVQSQSERKRKMQNRMKVSFREKLKRIRKRAVVKVSSFLYSNKF